MAQNWLNNLERLQDFMREHPEISISRGKVSIPREPRSDFYDLFNEWRRSFIKEKFPEMVAAGELLGESFNREMATVETMLNLTAADADESMLSFTENPVGELAKILWEPFFAVLKGTKKPGEVEEEYGGAIINAFNTLYYEAYENWLELALIDLFDSRQLLRVFVPAITGSFGHAQGYVMHLDLKPVVPPEESAELSLRHRFDYCSFSVPDFVVYSKALRKYVAVKAEHHEANWIALNASPERDWLPMGNVKEILGGGYILLYMDDNPLNLSLVNDAKVFCRPDVVIEFREKPNWVSEAEINTIRQRAELLNPKYGTLVVTGDSLDQDVKEGFGKCISVIETQVDSQKLLALVEGMRAGEGCCRV